MPLWAAQLEIVTQVASANARRKRKDVAERQQKITSIFHSAIGREPRERAAFLDGACASDPELRREVEALIESHEDAGTFLGSPAYERSADRDQLWNIRGFNDRS